MKRRLKIKKDNARARRVVQIVLQKNGKRETRTVHSLNRLIHCQSFSWSVCLDNTEPKRLGRQERERSIVL